jgi:hypothetical protein
MNARQKAKKYKREVELLRARKCEPIVISTESFRLRPLMAETCVPIGEYYRAGEAMAETFHETNARHTDDMLLYGLRQFIERSKDVNPHGGCVVYQSRIMLAERI